jgi:hypothetical protein
VPEELKRLLGPSQSAGDPAAAAMSNGG